MHTSQALRSSHFQYRRFGAGAPACVGFNSFCAGYHEQDRVGVVSPHLEDGILHAGYALLALTTAFYDAQRARGGDFFIYPQHFAIIGADQSCDDLPRRVGGANRCIVATGAGRLDLTPDDAGIGGAWGWLDVWPASNWLTASAAPAAMLKKVFDFQINRLFWPQEFVAREAPQTDPLPDYARRILRTRLKSVCYYNTSAPTVEISAAQPAAEIVRTSIKRLPTAVRRTLYQDARPPRPAGRESHRQVSVDDFLQDMESCFAV